MRRLGRAQREPDGPREMKHFFPMSRHRLLDRGDLIRRLTAGDPALVVLWGGGGSGKSVVAAQLAAAMGDDAPALWVRGDGGRREAERIWEAALDAMLEAGLVAGEGRAAPRRAGDALGGAERALEAFCADAPDRMVLVIDGVEAGREAGELLGETLLQALTAKHGLRVILTTRSRPSRLLDLDARMLVPLREASSDDLRLTPDEMDELLSQYLPEASSAERERLGALILRETGGWPIAAHAAVVEYAASGRPPLATRREFVSRYVDRLLREADETRHEALCATALFDEISAPVLAGVLGLEEERAAELLDGETEVGAGFWEEADGTRWYRHHDLIREELQSRAETELGEGRMRELHRRAAQEFERTGKPVFAMRAALHAEAWELLETLLLEHGVQRVDRRAEHVGYRTLSSVPQRVRDRYPVIAAFALIDEYAFPRGRLDALLSGLKALAGPRLAAESAKAGPPGAVASALRMVAARLSGNEDLAGRMAVRFEAALDQFDESEAPQLRNAIATGIAQAGLTHLHADRFDAAERVLERVGPGLEAGTSPSSAHVLALRALGAAWRGTVSEAGDAIERCEAREAPHGWHSSYVGAGYRIAAALLALEADDLGLAEEHVEALAPHEATIEHWPYLTELRALIAERRSGARNALVDLDRRMDRRLRRFSALPARKRALSELQARLRWHAGLTLPRAMARQQSLVGVYALLASERSEAARMLLGTLQQQPGPGERPRRRAELLLLQAESARLGEDTAAAIRFGTHAVEVMSEHGLRTPVLAVPVPGLTALTDLVPRLGPLALARPVPPPGIGALTKAERRSLVAVAEHGTVAAAAGSLFLSRETVKWHLARVYRKLGVSSRTEAIRAAADAGLFPQKTGEEAG